jgi:hypothetical protein
MGLTPYIVGGAGLGLMVIGGVLLGVSQGKASQVKERCGGGIDCTSLVGTERDDAMQLFNTAKGLEAGGWVTFGLGAAALATGTVLFFIDKKNRRSDKSTAWRVLPTAPASDAGLSLSTSF